MTDRQKAYALHLIQERTQALDALVDRGDNGLANYARALYCRRWQRENAAGENTLERAMHVSQASHMIEWLLTIRPDQPSQPTPTATPAPDVPAGRYAIVDADGVVKFYRVDKPTEGRWAGYTFVKVQASEEWHSVRDRAARDAILAAIAVDAVAAMRRYGLELGHCGNCGRALTDETSRAMGIGPDCAQRLGLDRSPYAEAARREQVARVLGTDDRIAPDMDEQDREARRQRLMDADDLMAEVQ